MSRRGRRRLAIACGAAGLLLLGLLAIRPSPAEGDGAGCHSCNARHRRLAEARAAVANAESAPAFDQAGKASSQ